MQADNVKSISKLKTPRKILGWLLATIAAVPITKWVESQLSLSFFSPVISGLWDFLIDILGWLAQPVTVPLWTLLAVSTIALLTTGGFIWAVVDANNQLDAADAEIDATNGKIGELMNPPKPGLTDNAHDVVMCVAGLTIRNMNAFPIVLTDRLGLDRLQVATALDELEYQALIEHNGTVELTRQGRVYVQLPKSLKRSQALGKQLNHRDI
ncbi:hypothetical protein [Pseudomonas sp. Ant30-3]|uniref:hypothetical protein n=1 Tax=Pseudomonas sp. Ant30-3 TaxID=1488328 RepID=UPI0004919E47|nr:hypothetical protein [Pseudomonas sp. Ant30-3]